MRQCFSLDEVFHKDLKKSFSKYSVIKIKNLIDKSVCTEACNYIFENEDRIINKYIKDKRGLTIDKVKNKKYIKYFEYPFKENSNVFGKFVSSDIFKLSEFLLESPVYLKSLEVHSRCALGTKIPPHQDNAYYGLKRAKGLTFYIPITKEFSDMGGLKNFKNPNDIELDHMPSDSSGFSLKICTLNNLAFDTYAPDYLPGDCTVHHSRSIHFANAVPIHAERSLVVRISIYSKKDFQKKGHSEWYRNMIERNREVVSKSMSIEV